MGPDGKINFVGTETRSVDDKGRSPIPRKFRKALEMHGIEELVLAPIPKEQVIRVYTPQLWQQVVDQLTRQDLSASGQRVAWLFRAQADSCDVDRSGRVLISGRHRRLLGLDSEVTWVGQGRFIDLLHPDTFEQMQDLPLDDLRQGSEEISRTLVGG